MKLKNNTKITILFGLVILLSFTQVTIIYKLQDNILDNTKQIQNIEAPLEMLTQQGINYGSIATMQLNASTLHAQNGDYQDIGEHKQAYDAAQIKLDSIFNRDARLLINQSKMPQEVKNNIVAKLKEIERLNLLMKDLGLKAFIAIDTKDVKTAYSLTIGGYYEKYQKELRSVVNDLTETISKDTLGIRKATIENSQQTIYLNLILSLTGTFLFVGIAFLIRSFLTKQVKLFSLLYENSGDALMTLEPPNWNFTSANSTTIKLFNLKNEKQFISLSPADLSPKKQSDGQSSDLKSKEMIEKAMKEGCASFEWTHKKYKGEDFYANVLLSKIVEDNKTYLQATVRDITEQKKLKDALSESEEIFDQFMINSPVFIYIKDEKFRLLKISKNMEILLGKPTSELLGKDAYELLPPEFAKGVIADDSKTLKEGVLVKSEETINDKFYLTMKFPVHRKSGKPDYLGGFSIDITEYKKMENKLKKMGSDKTS